MTTAAPSILIVDDEPQLRQLLSRLLSVEGFVTTQSDTIRSTLKLLEKQNFHAIILDVRLPDGNGVDTCRIIKEKYPETEVIIFTAFGNIADGVKGIKNGAFDYLMKGDDNNKIIPLVNKAIDKSRLQYKVRKLQQRLNSDVSFGTLIGKSLLMKQSIELAKKVAPTDASVIISGATGTGKKLLAKSIHNASNRAANAFVVLNCALLSRQNTDPELFGNLLTDSNGLIEEAHKGTLFLDEIGELSPEMQSLVQHFVETGEYYKSGDNKVHVADVRIIASSNTDIKKLIEKNTFKSDLYFRLATFEISLPTLNERKEDLEELAENFMFLYADKLKKKISGFSKDFLDKLKKHKWLGNVRELKNTIERACILCEKEELSVELLPFDFIVKQSESGNHSELKLSEMEKVHVAKVLLLCKGNKTKAAELLGISTATLYRKIDDFDLN